MSQYIECNQNSIWQRVTTQKVQISIVTCCLPAVYTEMSSYFSFPVRWWVRDGIKGLEYSREEYEKPSSKEVEAKSPVVC